MKGYSEAEVFTPREVEFFRRVTDVVRVAPAMIKGEWVRCHELARAVHRIFHRYGKIYDGKFGPIEHSWIGCGRTILDVYVPGELPQVQLVDAYATYGALYRPGHYREDIRGPVIDQLERVMRRVS